MLTTGCFHQRGIRQRHAHILGLPAINRVRRHTVPKQLALGTTTRLAPDAVIALLTRSVERHHDLIADLEITDLVALLDDVADEFVPADEVG